MKRASFINILCVATLLLPVTSQAAAKTVWRDGINYISIKESPQLTTEHPYTIKADQLARILSQVKITQSDSESLLSLMNKKTQTATPVFTDREIHVMAQRLSKTLTQASPGEMVTFSVSDFRNAYFGDKRLSVSGSVFVSNQHLNLLFGEVHVDIQKKYLRSGASVSNSRFASNAEIANFKLNTGHPEKEGSHDWSLAVFPGAEKVKQRHDWIKINLNRDYDYVRTEKAGSLEERYLSEQQKQQETSPELEERIRKLEAAQSSTTPKAEVVKASDTSMKNRLLQLRSLYEQGAIPEALYLEKMRAIINEL